MDVNVYKRAGIYHCLDCRAISSAMLAEAKAGCRHIKAIWAGKAQPQADNSAYNAEMDMRADRAAKHTKAVPA